MLARAFGATAVAVHAETLTMPAYFTSGQVAALEEERQRAQDAIAEEVRTFVGLHDGARFEVVVEDGPAADVILRLAEQADLVVMGTRRLHGVRRWWLGSVAEAVVRRSPVPVLVVPTSVGEMRVSLEGARILVPHDHDGEADGWVRACERALQGTVVRTDSIGACDPGQLRDAGLVVLPMTPADREHSHFDAIVHVLEACTHPVLFVPTPAADKGDSL
jgi:nucleotide-binding universal stress UspA family protein